MWTFCLGLVFTLMVLSGCGNAQRPRADALTPDSQIAAKAVLPDSSWQIAPAWHGLRNRLAQSGLKGPAVDGLLAQLASEPTQAPMGRKISELYQKRFFPKPKTAATQKYYKGVITVANAQLCRNFIAEHQAAFLAAQKRYGVSPAIASALLFVETRLGKVLADVPENAFYTLASMAVSTEPEDISQWLPKLKDYSQHLPWIRETMAKRADWAYNETRALVEHMLRDNIAPQSLPSSIYGAVGLCQFMPSNISIYAADGDGDGRVDLFNVPDAIASLANYLARHGWKAGIPRERQHKLLMTYNHSTVYANTILALADLVVKDGKGA